MRTVLFFFNDTATTEIYTLSLHDALPISPKLGLGEDARVRAGRENQAGLKFRPYTIDGRECAALVRRRSEEHTSELQSQSNLVCRLLLEKKKQQQHSKSSSGDPHGEGVH